MSFNHQMEINDMEEYDNSVNETFCIDESSNDFNSSLQVSKPSLVSHAQLNNNNLPAHKTRSGLKYNTSKESNALKRVNSSASCSFTGDELPSPSKMISSDTMTVIVRNELIPNINHDREEVSQDVEDDEDVPMEYDAEDQNESHDSAVSSPQTTINKYKINANTKLSEKNNCSDYVVIDDNSLISSTLSYNIQDNNTHSINNGSINNPNNSFTTFSISENQVESPSTSQSPINKPMQTRQMRQRIKRINLKPNRKLVKPTKNLFIDKQIVISTSNHQTEDSSIFLIPRYPLRSRARLEKVKTRLRESVMGSKTLETLPVELYYRIFQYLPIQDLFRIQRVNRRFKDSVDNHLVMVKRINFSCGLPFAFLPDCLNDSVLKRILSKTPEVTHILGFYPRKIEDVSGIANSLTYSGIMIGLRQCTKLRSVEIMDLELMSRVVHALSRVKFHGMFRNRPYSWEDEYANPLLSKTSTNTGAVNNIPVTNGNQGIISNNIIPSMQLFDNNELRHFPTKYGLCNKLTALKSLCNLVSLQQVNSRNLHINFINYNWLGFLEKMGYTPIGQGLPLLQPINQGPVVNLVTPIPPSVEKLIIPTTINNLTKLDLVSVCIQHLPRLENIKYLHLKWVRFSSPDPFMNFQAPKIQSFVMNNCIGPIRGMRYVRIFTALARSTQLNRLELVSTRIVEGLFENFFLDTDQGHRCFRNLQRLVLASNKEFGEVDVAALLLSSHASLNHLALSVSHSRNSLMLSLANAKVTMQKLESVILGYQDPFQSMLTGIEIHNLGLHDSPDHSLPICKITDRGIAALMKLAPKLISLHLRHAIYVEDPMMWLSKNWPYPIGNKPINPYENNEDTKDQLPNTFPLKSLTLENCPGIKPETVSFLLNHPATCFPQLEMLVLRDMFLVLPKCSIAQADIDPSIFNNSYNSTGRKHNSNNNFAKNLSCRGKLINYHSMNGDFRIRNQIIEGLNERFYPLPPIISPDGTNGQMHDSFNINNTVVNNSSINVGDIIDNTNGTQNRLPRIFIPTLTPNDIRFSSNDSGMFGMGSSGLALYNAAGAQVLGAQHTNLGASIRQNEFLRPSMIINAMKSISTMHKLENLGLGRLVLWNNASNSINNTDDISFSTNLSEISVKQENSSKRKRSRSNDKFSNNQSVNGIYFHKSMVPKSRRSTKKEIKSDKPPKKRRISYQTENNSTIYHLDNKSIDFQSKGTQTCVCGYIDWHEATWQRDFIATCDDLVQDRNNQLLVKNLKSSDNHQNTSNKSSTLKSTPSVNNKCTEINLSDYDCRLCSYPVDNFSNKSTISFSQPETSLKHRFREWEAQDAAVDTMSLRIYLKPQLYSLDLKQNTFAHLTTLHLEKVGLTHLILVSCHRLKSITLENCSELQAIVVNSGTAPPSDSMPNLRRIRIMRCPKFAIYNLLYQVTRFYPQHDDNLYITFRPFGEYNPLVEKALWINSGTQHVMVSHEYRQASSERNLEELCSSFDQLFREMLNFSESLIRRDILTVSDFSRVNYFTNGSFLRSEHGTDWDLLTDIPWISEVCCSMLPSDLTRTQQADQLYELLSEIQSHLGHMKLRRRGIHFHVQFRDVHKPAIIDETSLINEILPTDKQFSYLPYPYTDAYLEHTHPRDDLNANDCEPSLHDLYSDLYQDQCDFDFVSDVSMFPSHLQDLLEDNDSPEDISFGPDINEKVPIPQQFQTDKITKSITNNSTGGTSTHPVLQSRTTSSAFRVHNNNNNNSQFVELESNRTQLGCGTSSATASSSHNDLATATVTPSSIEYMSNKIHKFRSTITALKKSADGTAGVKVMSSSSANSHHEMVETGHSTRSSTAEMLASTSGTAAVTSDTKSARATTHSNSSSSNSGNSSSSHQHFRSNRH